MTYHHRELTVAQRRHLEATSLDTYYVLSRYDHYRSKGFGQDESFRAALAWAKNMDEQAVRRATHDTGYVR